MKSLRPTRLRLTRRGNGPTIELTRVRSCVNGWVSSPSLALLIDRRRRQEWIDIQASGSKDVRSTLGELED